jgi:integrase/recombinase XerD
MMQILPSYMSYLGERYAEKTAKMYWADVRDLAIFLRDKKIKDITSHNLQQWTGTLVSPQGKWIGRKTLNRKVSAIINFFLWLLGLGVITKDPAATLVNTRVQSPLPDYLYENEIKTMYEGASKDIRTYILVLLFLETGMKSNELPLLTKAHIDISDPYHPEIWIKHKGNDTKKDRKVALPPQFTEIYTRYINQYKPEDTIFPYTDRFIQMLFADLKRLTKIPKELTPKTLRHTHVVRAYHRGEEPDKIFDRIGLAPDSRKEADEMYSRLAKRGL